MSLALDASSQNLLRELAPQVLTAVMRRFRDFGAAEDAVQEALLAAATQWSREGLPDNPRAWLIRVASRRITDHVRAETARRRRESSVVSSTPADEQCALAADELESSERDDTLTLVFMCCHPALTRTSAIALTLRALGGLTTAEIAKAFLVPEATMAQRISRAKHGIQVSKVPFALPTHEESAARLASVLHVLYLIFSEGYSASVGADLQRSDLSNEALRLSRLLYRLMPDDPEVAGLLALMLLTDARRRSRTGPLGELIPLDEQDRSAWDQDEIKEGVALISRTLSRGSGVGPYQLQAAIAAVHDEAPAAEDTDWPQILALYGLLASMSDNPMVALNHAVALAMVHGPAAGLERLETLAKDPRVATHYRLDAVRAHLFERLLDPGAAVEHYLRAAEHTASIPERNYLITRAARLNDARK